MNSVLNSLSPLTFKQLSLAVVLLMLLVGTESGLSQVPPPAPPAQTPICTGTIAGQWTSKEAANSSLSITLQGNSFRGTYTFGQVQRTLVGTIDDGEIKGNWTLGGAVRSRRGTGTFTGAFDPGQHTLRLSFSVGRNQIDSQVWVCQPDRNTPSSPSSGGGGRGASPGGGGRSPGGGGRSPQSPSSTQPPAPGQSENHDYDNFATFDALPKAEQEKTLRKRGPRLPHSYKAYALSMRVLVAAGWPIGIDYSLDSDKDATLNITIEGTATATFSLTPASRNQLRVTLPSNFPQQPTVGKLTISALRTTGSPARFRLNGIAIGSRGVQALDRVVVSNYYAFNLGRFNIEGGLPMLFPVPAPDDLFFAIEVSVEDPTSIRVHQKPKQKIKFSLTSQSVFSNGRWELWHTDGFDWTQVWQEKTGSIEPQRRKTNDWDGIISFRKIVSLGDHSLQVIAWHGTESDDSFVIARATPNLTVIE